MASGAETVGEVGKAIDDDIGRGVWYRIGRSGGSPLVWTPHKSGAVADAAGRIEIEIVARERDHQDLMQLESQNAAARR